MDAHKQEALQQLAQQISTGFSIGFDLGGIKAIEGMIQANRAHFNQLEGAKRDSYIQSMVAFTGECLVKTYGGQWVMEGDRPGVQVGDQVVFPDEAVASVMAGQGEGNALSALFEKAAG